MLITKSKFLAGNQCLKRLYWSVHSPELAVQPDESDQSIIEQGREVGLLARQMFPGGVTVEGRDREEAIRTMTLEHLTTPWIIADRSFATHNTCGFGTAAKNQSLAGRITGKSSVWSRMARMFFSTD